MSLLLRQPVGNLAVEEARKVRVETLIAGDELVGDREAGHETTLLQPEDSTEGATEEDALNDGEGEEPGGEAGLHIINPRQCPVCLLLHTRNGLDGVEQITLVLRIVDIGVDQEGVGLGVNALNHRLARVEELRLRPLDLAHKSVGQILHDDSIGAGEESDDVLDEVALAIAEFLPVSHVLAQVNLFRHPNDGHMLLVAIPHILVADREDRIPVFRGVEQGFWEQGRRNLGRNTRDGSIQCKRRWLLL